jgi:hypothetical protein
MYILSFFTDDGLPKTGLTPTIKIRDVSDGSLLVNGSSMSEVGDGFYRYDYSAYDSEKDYAIVCDGGISLSDPERYVFAGNENYIDDITGSVLSGNISGYSDGSLGYTINEINNNLKKALGLMHHNIFIDETIYDAFGNMSNARVRIYSDSISVGTDSNVIGTYTISSSSSETGKFDQWKQIKV